jgi:hypothetical protein
MLEQQYQKRAAYFLFLLVAAALGFSSLSNAQEDEEVRTETTTTSVPNDEAAAPAPTQQTTVTTKEKEKSKISKGGFFIEPLIMASTEDNATRPTAIPNVGNSSGRVDGYGAGLKLGGHVSEALVLGVDARYSRSNLNDPFFASATADAYNVGPTIALQTPYAGIRLLGTYVLAGEVNPTAGTSGLDLRFRDARGWRLGAGLYIRRVGVNLEYQDLTYSGADVQSFGSIPVSNDVRVDTGSRGYALSLTFPIAL